MLTKHRRVIGSNTMAIDTVEMKLYFGEDGQIKVRDNDHEDVNVIIPNANVEKMTVDWTGRRIFWTEASRNRISVANLDGKKRIVVANTLGKPRGIAVDPISG